MNGFDMFNTKIDIEYDNVFRIYRIWLHKDEINHIYNFNMVDGIMTRTEIHPGVIDKNIKPFLELDHFLADLLFPAIGDFLEKKGRQTETENITKGKLDATERHLKDMQCIVFKLLKINDLHD